MATETHYKDGGVWRKAKELYYKDGGVWRKAKEIWYRDAGTWRKVFSGAGPVSAFDGNNVAAGFPTGAAVFVTLIILSDGTFSTSFGNANELASDDTVGDLWYSPTTGGIGNSFWVRATVSSGQTPSVGATGTWLALSSARSWEYNSGTGGPTSFRSGTLLLEIASDSGGANIVASGSYYMEASRES